MSASPSGSSTYFTDSFNEVLSEAESYRASNFFNIDTDSGFSIPTPEERSVGLYDGSEEIYRFLENCVQCCNGYNAGL